MELQITPKQKEQILGYKGEAFEFLGQVEEAATQFKDIVAAASETTGLKKGIISKYFKISYKDDVKKLTEEADVIGFLNEA